MGKKITPNEAEKLCNNFDSKYNTLCTFLGKDDNRSVLFTIQEIKNYINYLENQDAEVNGIRIYLGSYDDTHLTTAFLAPTVDGVDNTVLDVLNFGTSGQPPKSKYKI